MNEELFTEEGVPERPVSYPFENPYESGEEIVIQSVEVHNSSGTSKALFRLFVTPEDELQLPFSKPSTNGRHPSFAEDIFVGKGTRMTMQIPPLVVRPGRKLTITTNAPGALHFKLSGIKRKI